jgi:hypothetical protein
MEYQIIKLPKGSSAVLGKLVQDDLISRQTIAVRDTVALGLDGEDTIVMIEGSPEALDKAIEIVGDDGSLIEGSDKEEVFNKIKAAEDEVAAGLGLMFG